ncbi:MAG: type II toxin-antitoxin system HicA family toxin [Brevibacterium aurantiacum]|uniref:type II toxin-antitoxin system HicA family toxin n=1 Tax=Brevibacterium aurantiacum TaxID=273384 RepID=UPI000DF41CF4|nr:type II toxin-antitoxin system HicA family toxin [Brevibacterium aurantiacum]RCS87917.1 type II toxin-antitoxin system HicA family toxin [Brevibacterium aurantiacum]RCS93475.1 type II toxin-antitoxin system HicA family toxin [Brevibacterium aurantiacum]
MKPQKSKDVKKFIKSQGWTFIRQGRGSHEIWGNPETGVKAPIPFGHKEISAGVLEEIEKLLPTNVPKEWK